MSDAEAVKVAVRVRPFNTRETTANSKCIITMKNSSTTIVDPVTGEEKTFAFDHSYWSHNKADENFATQQTVFQDLGVSVLENAWAGYNCSLFAYGQTGSGKSYSMVGYGPEKGIIPLAMEEMFRRIDANPDKDITFHVEASMMEIYNEQVRDLFNPKNNGKQGGLPVREHPKTGPYVDGLSSCVVKSYADLERLMDEGSRARTVASTNMNATSSRAHTVFTILFKQTKVDSVVMKATDRVSKINLVDLAGSERADSTGATGDRLKEGCAINKSLSALGNCISALADQSKAAGNPKAKKVFIPYRDSVLTWLLKESLGGNAKTIMIAALSPADLNFEETLSTLRYADRAKQIKTRAIVNEDPNAKMIRELREEIDRLRKQLVPGGAATPAAGGALSPAGGPASPRGEGPSEKDDEMEKLRIQLLESQKIISQLQMSDAEKEARTKQINMEREEALASAGVSRDMVDVEESRKRIPHFVNLNEDPMMNESLIYFLKEGPTRIGRKNPENPPEIQLNGLNIQKEHCIVEHQAPATPSSEENPVPGQVWLNPCAGARIYVNGKQVSEPTQLCHGYRVILGNNHIFRFNHPIEAAIMRKKKSEAAAGAAEAGGEAVAAEEQQFDWEFALKELAEAQGRMLRLEDDKEKERDRELELQMKDMQEKMEKERIEQQAHLEKERKQLEEQSKRFTEEMAVKEKQLKEQLASETEAVATQRIKDMQAKLQAEQAVQKAELDRQQKDLAAKNAALEEALKKQKEVEEEFAQRKAKEKRERSILEERLLKAIPMVNEANAIAEELEKDVRFDIKLITSIRHSANISDLPEDLRYMKSTDLSIRCVNQRNNTTAMWGYDKFVNRVYLMREMYQNFLGCIDANEEFIVSQDDDPFYDPLEDQLIGVSMVYLQPLSMLVDCQLLTPIIDYKGKQDGALSIEIIPCGPSGDPDDADVVDKPEDLIGSRMDFKIRVPHARGLPGNQCDGVFVKYKFFLDEEFTVTERCEKPTINPNFGFEKMYTVQRVTPDLVNYLKNDALSFEVYGRPVQSDDDDNDNGSSSPSMAAHGNHSSGGGPVGSDRPFTAAARAKQVSSAVASKQAELDKVQREKQTVEEEKEQIRKDAAEALRQKQEAEKMRLAALSEAEGLKKKLEAEEKERDELKQRLAMEEKRSLEEVAKAQQEFERRSNTMVAANAPELENMRKQLEDMQRMLQETRDEAKKKQDAAEAELKRTREELKEAQQKSKACTIL